MNEKILEKLSILADAAKYDVSCASSGTTRPAVKGGIGTATGWGICHSFT
ncbi:MAG: radical SAM protein, partial [Proteiniphilum sp.]|nr:radical SAM protein [Proteiniphilum sp.]MDD2726533.1 radical SAM protein [Proteiniphilum sp.]MDD3556414.1 radical SAM protein [Proteiniphilum sp.]MDD4485809.1 radical SAM protein [Proteiniphilum sp.]